LAEEFEWVYQYVKKDVWLVGLGIHHYLGSSLVGGSPTLPVFAGEAQCMLLGCKSTAFPDKSQLVTQPWTNDLLAQPLPSIPFAK
jgi:acetoacetyl-CoA synthetase